MDSADRFNNIGTQARNPWIIYLFITSIFLITTVEWNFSQVLYDPDTDRRVERAERVDYLAKGSPVRRMTYPLLGVFGLLGLMRPGKSRIIPQGLVGWMIVFCVCWAFLSVIWSDDMSLTFRRLISFAMFCLASLALGSRYSPRQIASFIVFSAGSFVFLGLVAEIDVGTFSPMTSWYRFTGVQHPNSQAICCALVLLSCVYLADVSRAHRKFFLVIASLSFVLLILTKSRTSFAAAIVAVMVFKSFSKKASRNTAIIFAATLIFAASVMVLGDKAVSAVGSGVNLGRSAEGVGTLNSRTWLWMECRGYASQRPGIGYGFNAFWTPERMLKISETQGWSLGSAHSIYMDLILNLGLIGFMGFLSVIGLSILRARSRLGETRNIGYLFLLSFLIFYMLHGVLESIFVRPGYLAFASMVVFAHLGFSTGYEDHA